jgi:hypothetical protein
MAATPQPTTAPPSATMTVRVADTEMPRPMKVTAIAKTSDSTVTGML